MQHPEEGTIHAWLDGELSADEAAAVEAHLAECAECSAVVAEARGLIAASSRIVSALDIVPGGVIPVAAPKRRAWYAGTQLRAAAAVIIVAGASLLVVRGTERSQWDLIVSRSAPAPSLAPSPAASPIASETSKVLSQAESPAKAAPLEKRVASAPVRSQRDEAAAKAAAAPPVTLPSDAAKVSSRAPAPVPAAVQQEHAADEARAERRFAPMSDSTRMNALSGKVSGVVITGVATTGAAAPIELNAVRADTLAGGIQTTYRTSSGVELTLIESDRQSPSPLSGRVQKMNPTAAPERADAVTAASGAAPVINSITWTQKGTGRIATLTGPLSKEALEALRERLPPEKR
jgi:Putative zinc-finger